MGPRSFAFLVVFLLATVPCVNHASTKENAPRLGRVSKPYGLGKKFDLSQYSMKTVDGKEAGTLADFGKYVYVEVWATW